MSRPFPATTCLRFVSAWSRKSGARYAVAWERTLSTSLSGRQTGTTGTVARRTFPVRIPPERCQGRNRQGRTGGLRVYSPPSGWAHDSAQEWNGELFVLGDQQLRLKNSTGGVEQRHQRLGRRQTWTQGRKKTDVDTVRQTEACGKGRCSADGEPTSYMTKEALPEETRPAVGPLSQDVSERITYQTRLLRKEKKR